MAGYRIYILDREGHITSRIEISRQDDKEAIAAAKLMVPFRDAEVWTESALVMRIPAAVEAITPF